MNIAQIDQNFSVPAHIEREGYAFFDVMNPPFRVHGIFFEEGCFRRVPRAIAEQISDRLLVLSQHTAGGRVRFVTDSPSIAIYAELHQVAKFSHFSLTGSAGMDLYNEERYVGTFMPPCDVDDRLEGSVNTYLDGKRVYTLNLPLYSGLKRLFIGIREGSVLEAAPAYAYEKPIVYYGSSITQGGCASRAGNSYESIISRRFNVDHINLGFSGNAKAEDSMADYVKGLPAKIFVYDYDHNAPDVAHLAATHERMFLRVREANPDLPVLMLTRPKYYLKDEEKQRLEIVRGTYERACARGDRNVWFIPGPELLLPEYREGALVDNCHPSDVGFFSMARVIGDKIAEILTQTND